MSEAMIDTSAFARNFRLRRQHDGFCYQLTAEVLAFHLPAAVLKQLAAHGCGPFGPEDFIPFGEPVCRDHNHTDFRWNHDGYCTGGSGAYILRPLAPVAEVVAALQLRKLRLENEAEAASVEADKLAEADRLALAKTAAILKAEQEREERKWMADPMYRVKKLERQVADRLEKPVLTDHKTP